MQNHEQPSADPSPLWKPLPPRERRVAGVLVEKAKTTPGAYPLSLNALMTGCNQKSNRFPAMQLNEEDIIVSIDSLRSLGAAAEVQGGGRVPKYRHLLYEWLGVDKAEIAVMAELLLRGAQTVGELRGRCARMEPIADLNSLQPILDSLHQKKLIVYLTPQGRGCIVTHALYREQELVELRQQYGQGGPSSPPTASSARVAADLQPSAPAPTPSVPSADPTDTSALQLEIESLRADAEGLRDELTRTVDQLRDDLEDVKRQLGI